MTTHATRRPRAFRSLSRLFGIAVVGLAALGVPGCAGRRGALERGPEAFRPLAESFSRVGYRWDWSGFPSPARGDRILFVESYPDLVVTQDSASKVVVLEAASGRARWSNELATRATKFVGIVRDSDPSRGDRLVVSSESEAFLLEVHTGSLLGRQRFDKVVNTRPLLVGPVAWYGTPQGEMLGHLLTRSVKFYGYQMPKGAIEQPLVRVGGAIGAVSQAGEVAFLDATSGMLVGKARIYGGTASQPAASEQAMFVASLDQSLYAFSPMGPTLWRKRTSQPITARPVVVGQTVYCEVAGTGFTAYEAATGKERWATREAAGSVIGVRNKRLLVWDGRTMYLVDAENGGIVERVELPGIQRFSLDSFEDGNLYAVNSAGVVGKFVPR